MLYSHKALAEALANRLYEICLGAEKGSKGKKSCTPVVRTSFDARREWVSQRNISIQPLLSKVCVSCRITHQWETQLFSPTRFSKANLSFFVYSENQEMSPISKSVGTLSQERPTPLSQEHPTPLLAKIISLLLTFAKDGVNPFFVVLFSLVWFIQYLWSFRTQSSECMTPILFLFLHTTGVYMAKLFIAPVAQQHPVNNYNEQQTISQPLVDHYSDQQMVTRSLPASNEFHDSRNSLFFEYSLTYGPPLHGKGAALVPEGHRLSISGTPKVRAIMLRKYGAFQKSEYTDESKLSGHNDG